MESEESVTREWPVYVEVKVEKEEPPDTEEIDFDKEESVDAIISACGDGDLSDSLPKTKEELIGNIKRAADGNQRWTLQPVKIEPVDGTPSSTSLETDGGDHSSSLKNIKAAHGPERGEKRRLCSDEERLVIQSQVATVKQAAAELQEATSSKRGAWNGLEVEGKKDQLGVCNMTHTGDKPFACELCEYTSAYAQRLKRHMMTHTGEKPYACEYCEFTCSEAPNLKRHVMTHTGEKPYACEYCEYTCTHAPNLRRHMMTHTGEKPFACELCNYTSARANSLKRHMMTHTGEKPFACELCKYTTARANRLNRNMMTHTGE